MALSTSGRELRTPFYIDSVEALREKLARAERDGTRMGQVWAALRRRAQAAPEQFPWFTPFVALVTGKESDLEAARQAIRQYVAGFESISFSMGVQFHFWCFAFPHARWSLYFQWLQSLNAWDAAEEAHLREELLSFQFTNFFYGMRTKPEPECVDNQTMSLCFSNALLGHLFGSGENASPIAQRMYADGVRRLPSVIGGMPPSGYSGEGSTYMDHVVGPCIPYLVEFLERVEGGDWYTRALEPHGGSAEAIVRMIAREWLPSGLTLPWDHYGYSLPMRSCIAYGAHRTKEPLYTELLERHANWSHDTSVGWGYDDLVWSLIWWPEEHPVAEKSVFPCWAAPEVGAALVSDNTNLYLMQMWDETTPGYPTRAHMNPNALVMNAYGSPLMTDGIPNKECTAFNYDDTWKELHNMTFTAVKTNFGPGCAGSHGVLLVDDWEGMRAEKSYDPQATLVAFDEAQKSVTGDVTPLYREHWADTQQVRRRSSLCEERFWLIEDLAAFTQEHKVTARWYLRPTQVASERGVMVETAEGVRLRLLPLLGPDDKTVQQIAGYPERLDGQSLQVNFHQRGAECRWLWLAWPEETHAVAQDIAEDWQVVADPENTLDVTTATQAIDRSTIRLPFTMPAFMLAELPVVRRWWYRKTITAPDGAWWLRLPRLMSNAQLWINGEEIDLSPYQPLMDLMSPQVLMPAMIAGQSVEILMRTDCGASQYGKEDHGGTGFSGQPAVMVPATPDALLDASYRDGVVTIVSATRRFEFAYALMDGRVSQ